MLASLRCSSFLVAAALGSLLLACPRKTSPHRGRSVPVCATQDCATGRIVDDGCADDGRCASCVNACPSPLTGSTSSSIASVPDASSGEPRGGSDATLDAAPAPPAQLRALAGAGTSGVFWIPEKGDFPDADLLLLPDGRYFTHQHDRPASAGTWRMNGDTLTLDGWMGDEQYEISDVHIDGHELRGSAGGVKLVLRRMR